ncbi:MAG: peptidoglycan-associated lipoprotein Pal [Longimicrobiales bacterium]|nr:peptidoglycan-associated lipoprotein Pal [Longimicrobiales bacterium]
MIVRRFFVTVFAATLLVGACGGDPPPPPPPPPMPDQDSIQRIQDSIAAAEAEARRRAEEAEAARRAEEARQRAIREARETLYEMVHFEYDESEIEPDAEQTLRRKVEILRASPQVNLRIEGHADERGSTEYNLALGNRRAESVRQFLVGFGLDESRFSIVSFGESRPLVNASNEQAWAQNRRAEFVITSGINAINPPN